MSPNCFPDELKALPQFVVWRLEKRDGKPKLKKVPYTLSTGRKASPTTPLGKRNLSYLDAEVAWKSHRKLTRALSALRERAWFHYMDLRAVYLEDGSNPRLIEKWRQQVAQENHGGAKRRLRVIEEAIEFILDEVGEYRLTVPLPPTGGKGTKDHERRRRRYNALISFYDRLETGASPTEAVREVAAEYSTNASTVWRWVKEMGG